MDRIALTAAIPLLAISTFFIGRVPPTCSTYSSTVEKSARGESGPLVLLLDMAGAAAAAAAASAHTHVQDNERPPPACAVPFLALALVRLVGYGREGR